MSEGVLSPGDILPDLDLVSLDSGGLVKLRKRGIQVAPVQILLFPIPILPLGKVILASSYS